MRHIIAGLACALLLTACATVPVWLENLVICMFPCAVTSVHMSPIESTDTLKAAEAERVRAATTPCKPTGAVQVSFAEVQAMVFDRRCGLKGACHLASSHSEASLDLSATGARAPLLENAHGANRCDPKLGIVRRVVPGDPEHSMLWQIVAGDRCGPQMPLRSQPLNCDDQERVYSWIKGGAQP